MKLTFTLHDAQEISSTAYRAFISTFHYKSDESESDFQNLILIYQTLIYQISIQIFLGAVKLHQK